MPAEATPPPQKRVDRSALMLMLSYIEAECQSLGAADSARHVAMAAALLRDEVGSTAETAGWPARFRTPQGHA